MGLCRSARTLRAVPALERVRQELKSARSPDDSWGMERAAEHHISGIYSKLLVQFLVETMTPSDIDQLLDRAGETRSLAELAEAGSWTSYDQFRRLLEERSRLQSDSLYAWTELLTDWLQSWELAAAAQSLGSPGELLASGSELNPLMPILRFAKTEIASNEWIIREWFDDGYEPFPEFCDFAAAQYALIPIVFHLPPGEVVEEECQCRGDAACRFRLRWQQHDTEAQKAEQYRKRAELLEARLEQLERTISDLASNERHEEVLQGFVASSLRTAVGSRGALLALEPGAGMPRRIFSEGLPDAEAQRIADGLLAGEVASDQIIAVEVTSARRRYGVLAVDEAGGVFSALSQATLETYARLAAAALDTAAAVEEARDQANTAKVLLELATSLTEIVSTEEMAAKVAQAVPDVIDCDSAGVFLNSVDDGHTSEDGFQLAGSIGLTDRELAHVGSQRFHTAPPDLVCDHGIERTTYSGLGFAASVSASILVSGEQIGFIVASVKAGPERLTITPRLATRLKGLAAQASTAISNARLVDQIRFQAVHDALTGLPNRVMILDRAEQMLARARRSDFQLAALFIDLDGFKQVNDTFGHAVGDRLLEAVSSRISLTIREVDSVGRLGGDEFVVLVDGSATKTGPELVAQRLLGVLGSPFELPGVSSGPLTLSASIGIASGVRDSATDSCATRTLPCTKPKQRERTASWPMSLRCIRRSRTAMSWRRICVKRCRTRSSSSSTSPSSIWLTGIRPESRRSCAGTIPSAAWCSPMCSSPSWRIRA